MKESFELPVKYNGEVLYLPAKLLKAGDNHKFEVEVYGQQILFEPADDKTYKGAVDKEKINALMDPDLLHAVAEGIATHVKKRPA